MKSLLPVDAYCSDEWFAREQSLLFEPLWQFIAPKALLSVNHAFVRRLISGVDVVVQNYNGQLHAFENICSHRLSPIQTKSHGVRPLMCPYHAWRYDDNGNPSVIPWHDECYKYSESEKTELKLRSFEIFEFGQLVFINIAKKPIDFFEQFALNNVDSLRAASECFDTQVLVTQFACEFNWKLVYENLRDSIHPRVVHSKTIYKDVKFSPLMSNHKFAQSLSFKNSGSADRPSHLARLRMLSEGGLDAPMPNRKHQNWQNDVLRYGDDEYYLNWLMYPNLHVASGTAGYSFIIEHHIPVSAKKTDLFVYYLTGKKKKRTPASVAILLEHIKEASVVLREDIDILERLQQGLRLGLPRANLGAFEYKNLEIERWYMDTLDGIHEI